MGTPLVLEHPWQLSVVQSDTCDLTNRIILIFKELPEDVLGGHLGTRHHKPEVGVLAFGQHLQCLNRCPFISSDETLRHNKVSPGNDVQDVCSCIFVADNPVQDLLISDRSQSLQFFHTFHLACNLALHFSAEPQNLHCHFLVHSSLIVIRKDLRLSYCYSRS